MLSRKRRNQETPMKTTIVCAALGAALVALLAAGRPPAPQAAAQAAQRQPDPKKPEQPKDLPQPGVFLTVYENFALVKDRRELPDLLQKGVNVVRFRDVAGT